MPAQAFPEMPVICCNLPPGATTPTPGFGVGAPGGKLRKCTVPFHLPVIRPGKGFEEMNKTTVSSIINKSYLCRNESSTELIE